MTTHDPFELGWQLRERILPALARIDKVEAEWPRIARAYQILVDTDLNFDLRQGPPYPSNLCEENAALELGYTFGGRDQCGVRYSYEPTAPPGVLRNRYTLFRDRMMRAMAELGEGYDRELLLRAFQVGVPRRPAPYSDRTICIAAVHHYRDRPPRLKAYFSCDYDDDRQARQAARQLVALADSAELDAQLGNFFRRYRPQGGVRMVGFDFEPHSPVELKVYKTGEQLTRPALDRLIGDAGGGAAARDGLRAFQDIFLDGQRDPAEFDLVSMALRRGRAPGLKLYLRPVDFYSDGEALRRLRRWYAQLEAPEQLAVVERGLGTVVPLDQLDGSRGFFNYVSVDVGAKGVTKTSVYFAPQIALNRLARDSPEQLTSLS